MRALHLCLLSLMMISSHEVVAQTKPSPKVPGPGGETTRYFTSIDGLMNGNADVILKETRQGKTLTSAVLDVCYRAEKGSDRKDRFVVNLAVNGATLTGTTQSIGDKLPVTVKLVRKPTGDTFEFKGQIGVGQTVTEVASSDNSDLSETEFRDNQPTDDGIVAVPKDFSEVSPESIAIKVKLEAVVGFLEALKGQNVEVALTGLSVTCEALRVGEQVINLSVDPDRASDLIAKLKSSPGVVAAGWSSGSFDMERTIRFTAAAWRDGERLNRDKLAAAIAGVTTKTLSAELASSKWSDDTGKLTLTFKRPSQVVPALKLTDTIEVTALAAPDKPGGSDHLMLWISSPSVTTADETPGPKLNLVDQSGSDEEGTETDDSGTVTALAKEFKAQRWDADKAAWR